MSNDMSNARYGRLRSQERDRALARISRITVAGGAGAVFATGALAVWLGAPQHSHPGATNTGRISTPVTGPGQQAPQQGSDDGGGLQPPAQPPGGVLPGDQGTVQQPPLVTSGGS